MTVGGSLSVGGTITYEDVTNVDAVGLTSYANRGDIVEVIAYKAFNVGNVTNATGNFDVGGNLNGNTDLNVTGLTTTKNLNVTGVSTLTGASYLADVTELVLSLIHI